MMRSLAERDPVKFRLILFPIHNVENLRPQSRIQAHTVNHLEPGDW